MEQTATEWICIREARSHLEAAHLVRLGEKLEIVREWAAAGALDVRAKSVIRDGNVALDVCLPREIWPLFLQSFRGWVDWHQGQLLVRGAVEGFCTRECKAIGLEINKAQLQNLAPLPRAAHADGTEGLDHPKVVTIRGKIDAWHDFWMAAMRMLNDGKLEGIQTQKELRTRLLGAIDEKLSEESVKPQVHKIWYAFKETPHG